MQNDSPSPENKKIEHITAIGFDAPNIEQTSSKSGFNKSYFIIGLAAFFVLITVVFLLTTKALLITTNAEQANIKLSDGFNITLGSNRYLIFNGQYRIAVDAPGYHPNISEPQISSASPSNLHIELSPLPGQVQASFSMSTPDNSPVQGSVRLISSNGILIETLGSPNEAEHFLFESIEPGVYKLQADAYLYSPLEKEVEVRGKEITEEVSLQLEPNWGYLNLEVTPQGAELFSGEQLISSNLELSLDAGTDQANSIPVEIGTSVFSVSLSGYKPWVRELTIDKETSFDLGLIQLEPVDTQLEIDSSPTAVSITVNGQFMGQTPLTLDLLPNETHQIQLFKAGYQSQNHEIVLAQNTVETRSYNLQPDLVDVSLSISPDNAQIRINGELQSSNSRSISLPSIKHQIEVSAAGYESQSIDFLPVKGSRQLVQIRLLSDEQALWANTPYQYTNKVGNDMLLFRDAGIVSLGSSRREPGRRANEVQWNANLKKAFYVSTTEVTNEEYRRYDNSHSSGHFETIGLDGPERPVVGISWQQAALYCNWLSEQSGLDPFYQTQKGFVSGVNPSATGYRLLTEAEWSYLARKTPEGLTRKYIWGDSETAPESIENFADQSIAGKINFTLENSNDGFPASSSVASFEPNDKGIYDLAGNVLEWVNDWYQPIPQEGSDAIIDPLGPDEGEFHVIRGASWARGYLPQLRLAYRDYDSKGRNDLGFRVARYALPGKD